MICGNDDDGDNNAFNNFKILFKKVVPLETVKLKAVKLIQICLVLLHIES